MKSQIRAVYCDRVISQVNLQGAIKVSFRTIQVWVLYY